MTILDDGRGFSAVANTHTSGGLGLIGMKERAEALGGHAFIESSAGAGTKILVEVRKTI